MKLFYFFMILVKCSIINKISKIDIIIYIIFKLLIKNIMNILLN